ncbi:MAG: hypothetical protein AAB440_03330 [Patescibacteria group bacterium]
MTSRFIPIVGILIAIGLFLGYVHPTYTGPVAALRAQVDSYNTALDAAQAFSEKENELLSEKNAISNEDLARLETMLPNGVDNVQLILDLDALANRTGVRLSNFDVAIPEESETESGLIGNRLPLGEQPADSLTLAVSATGTYGAFRAFLEGTEYSLRLLDLVGLEVRDSATGVYTYDMIFRIYWLR